MTLKKKLVEDRELGPRLPLCSTMFVHVRPCSFMFVHVRPCSSMFIHVRPCSSISLNRDFMFIYFTNRLRLLIYSTFREGRNTNESTNFER